MDDVHMDGPLRSGPDGPCVLKAALQEVLPAAAPADVESVLDRLWSCGRFTVERAPEAGLVMCAVTDPFDTPFHLGEVFVTRADVRFDSDSRGCGVACGDAPEQALLLASVEAAERGGGGSILAGIPDWIRHLRCLRDDRQAGESRCAAATRVRFDSMRREKVDFGSLGG
jgi:phosphonate C-P lyase system protein PhnG